MHARLFDPNPSPASPRRLRPSRGRTLFAGGLLVAVLSISAGIALPRPAGERAGQADISNAPTRIADVHRVAAPSVAEGHFYPFSVVTRRVHPSGCLTTARRRDAVAADRYGPMGV